MRPLLWLPVLSLSLLASCSTMQQPAQIPPPPVALISKCAKPSDLPEGATGQDLAQWVMAWIGKAGCEQAKREALIESWPR